MASLTTHVNRAIGNLELQRRERFWRDARHAISIRGAKVRTVAVTHELAFTGLSGAPIDRATVVTAFARQPEQEKIWFDLEGTLERQWCFRFWNAEDHCGFSQKLEAHERPQRIEDLEGRDA